MDQIPIPTVSTDWEKKEMGDSWVILTTRQGRITIDWKVMGEFKKSETEEGSTHH